MVLWGAPQLTQHDRRQAARPAAQLAAQATWASPVRRPTFVVAAVGANKQLVGPNNLMRPENRNLGSAAGEAQDRFANKEQQIVHRALPTPSWPSRQLAGRGPAMADMQVMLLTWLNTFPLTVQQQDFTDLFDGARGGIAHARQAGWRSPFFVRLKCCVGGARPLAQKAWTRARVPCRAGVALLEALAEMDDTVDMEDIHRDVGEKFPFAVRNVKKFVAHLDSYYREELDMDADFEYIDAKDVGESHDEGVLTDLITLLIGCAIMVKDNQKFIERIMSLVARPSPAPAACERARAPRVHTRARVRAPSKAAARTLDQ